MIPDLSDPTLAGLVFSSASVIVVVLLMFAILIRGERR